jgi:hypothetical protein
VALPPTASEEAKGALRTLWQMAAFHQLSRPAIRPARPLEGHLRRIIFEISILNDDDIPGGT